MFIGSAEELIKQELQAVAEGVAASVLHSSTPSIADSNKHGSEASRSGEAQNSIAVVQTGVEVEVLPLYILIFFRFLGTSLLTFTAEVEKWVGQQGWVTGQNVKILIRVWFQNISFHCLY